MNGALPTGYSYYHHFNEMICTFFTLNITESFHILQCFFIQYTKQIPVSLENMLLKI